MKEFIEKTIAAKGFKNLNEIQQEVIPSVLRGQNIIATSPTGTGKTHAFLLPIMEKLDTNGKLQAIIIAPTRELATQIYNEALEFTNYNDDIRLKLLIGGIESRVSETPHIIIGTPGRVAAYCVRQANVNINTVETVVLDEIDMICELNFMEDVDSVISRIKNVQILAFSATLDNNVKSFIRKYISGAKMIEIGKKTPGSVNYVAINSKHLSKSEALLGLCKCINPYVCMVFASKKKDLNDIYNALSKQGYKVGLLHGDLDDRERKITYKRIKNNEFNYIVCSDIASRGLDLRSVSHVVSVDFPKEKEYFYHRAGRCGRAGETGTCFILYNDSEASTLKSYKNELSIKEQEIKNGSLKDVRVHEKKKKVDEVLEQEIKKAVRRVKTNKVKPNYKKKVREAVAKAKQRRKREIIKEDIKKRTAQRAKERVRMEKYGA